jgi:hypothetical protein
MKNWKVLLAAGALSLAATLPAAAATLNVDANGFLTGASGVTVATSAGTKTYNVEFLSGSCASIFSNCAADPASSSLPAFAFTTSTDAVAASQSLLDQVFVDGIAGDFDSNPELTRGCLTCFVLTPFRISLSPFFLEIAVVENGFQDLLFLETPFDPAFVLEPSRSLGAVYAVWTEVTPVPLPAGVPLVLSGVTAFAGLAWRKRRETRRAQV